MHLLLLLAPSEGGGFDPLDLSQGGNTLWTWVIFLVTLPLAWKMVMGPITRALEERDERATEAIASAERASQEAQEARAEVEIKLGEAQTSAAQLLSEARERAESREREIMDTARKEADAMIERARTDIDAEKEKALLAVRNEVVDLAIGAAGQILGRTTNSEDDRRLAADIVGATTGADA
jgi:F-type H+-transporting ATPase subunit b